MVKYLALAMALVGSLVVVDLAQAGHRHHRRGGGCHGGNCYAAPVGCANGACGVPVYAAPVGCANGACGVPVYGAPVHGVPVEGVPSDAAPPAPGAPGAPPAPAAPEATSAPAPQPTQYISTGYRRGLFGRRR